MDDGGVMSTTGKDEVGSGDGLNGGLDEGHDGQVMFSRDR